MDVSSAAADGAPCVARSAMPSAAAETVSKPRPVRGDDADDMVLLLKWFRSVWRSARCGIDDNRMRGTGISDERIADTFVLCAELWTCDGRSEFSQSVSNVGP